MKKLEIIFKLLTTKQFIVFTDKKIYCNANSKFIEKSMFDLMDYTILEIEKKMEIEETKP